MSEHGPLALRIPRRTVARPLAVRAFLLLALAGVFTNLVTSAFSAAPAASVARKPNLLIIVADDHGGETLGIAGDPRQATKNIDQLAGQGVYFDHAFCNAPLCTASRQTIITGKMPHATGVTRLGSKLSDDVLTLGGWLTEQGYRTCAIGKMHFNSFSHHGFDERIDVEHWKRHLKLNPPSEGDHRRAWRPFVDPPEVWLNADTRNAGLPLESMTSYYFATQAIECMKRDPGGKPFALIVSFYEPHAPFNFPRHWYPRFRSSEFTAPTLTDDDLRDQPSVFRALTPEQVRGIQAAYFNALSFVDSQVGRVLRAVDDLHLADDTLVVYLGDNGYMLGQHGRFEKHCFYEPAVRVPFIIRWNGHLPAGERNIELVELADVLPTILSLMHIPAQPGIQGINLEPLIKNEPKARKHDVVFSEYLETEEAMVRSDRYKLIVGTGNKARRDAYHSAKPVVGPYQKLYDLIEDPAENHDLGHNPRYDSVREQLTLAMYHRFVSTWTDPEPIPAGLAPLQTVHWCLVPRDK